MTKNPFYNALAAIAYISLVVTIMNFASRWATERGGDNILIPIGILSLFVLSAATMGYIVLYQPITMYLDGQRKEAVSLFWKTIATLAVLAALTVIIAFSIFRY